MPADLRSIVHEVEAAVGGGDAVRRREMLRGMTGLFVGQAARLSEAQVAAFDAVILRLAREIETGARAELSERLADLPNAPRAVVRDLALDAAEPVAGPVLERSSRLSEDDLVQVAEQRGQGHLMALTRRSTLSERVTDVLLHRGDREVARSVAGNEAARLSEHGHTLLATRAGADPLLLSALGRRLDIPPVYRKRLVELAEHRARDALGATFDAKFAAKFGAEFGAATTDAVSRAAAPLKAPARDDALLAAEVAVSARARKADLSELMVADWLQAGQETEALIALARLTGVPSRVALQAYEAESDEPLLMLVRASRCGWRILKLLMGAKAGTAPSEAAMQGTMEAFLALSIGTAQRVVRFSVSQVQAAP